MTINIKSIANGAVDSKGNSNPAGGANSSSGSNSISPGTLAHSDRVSLTASAIQLGALEEYINSLPIADAGRIAETRHALATGIHQINPGSTADGLLATERAFAQK